ncbi:hypothetical protein TrLO_g15114 [Triparma laevis f. longispina]|uniref:Membrane-associated protein n=1 Tax=Triparma laevis f. longispina TaxID=1714387 RepID=A0A9W7C9Y1_9STRA|nr:hypothetical protein TrLO_g15114 [Triparma laevis f. longispina]
MLVLLLVFFSPLLYCSTTYATGAPAASVSVSASYIIFVHQEGNAPMALTLMEKSDMLNQEFNTLLEDDVGEIGLTFVPACSPTSGTVADWQPTDIHSRFADESSSSSSSSSSSYPSPTPITPQTCISPSSHFAFPAHTTVVVTDKNLLNGISYSENLKVVYMQTSDEERHPRKLRKITKGIVLLENFWTTALQFALAPTYRPLEPTLVLHPISEIPHPSKPNHFVPRNMEDLHGKILQHHVFPIPTFQEVNQTKVWFTLSLLLWLSVLFVKKLIEFYTRLLQEMFREDVGIFGADSSTASKTKAVVEKAEKANGGTATKSSSSSTKATKKTR